MFKVASSDGFGLGRHLYTTTCNAQLTFCNIQFFLSERPGAVAESVERGPNSTCGLFVRICLTIPSAKGKNRLLGIR